MLQKIRVTSTAFARIRDFAKIISLLMESLLVRHP